MPFSDLIRGIVANKEQTIKRKIKTLTGYVPKNITLYEQSLRHSSIATDKKTSNERLEFLGDAVLSLVIADYLFKKFPFKHEGYLTDMRSKMVSRQQLNSIAARMGIKDLIVYNKQDKLISKTTITGNALEALVGAVYMDRGYKIAAEFIIKKIVNPYLNVEEVEQSSVNYKSKMMEWGQKSNRKLKYEIVQEGGRQKQYLIALMIDEVEMGRGMDINKKSAEKKAAQMAFEKLKLS